jgi:hypothetical protein
LAADTAPAGIAASVTALGASEPNVLSQQAKRAAYLRSALLLACVSAFAAWNLLALFQAVQTLQSLVGY